MHKNVFKAIGFLSILTVLLILSSLIVRPKNNDKESGMYMPDANGILAEKKNTIDALFIGDSLIYTSILPTKLYEDHGFTSYDLSTPAQRLYDSYEYLLKALDTQKPSIVFIESNGFFREFSVGSALKAKVSRYLPVITYHNRWKSLKWNDFTKKPEYSWINYNKGYRGTDKVKSPTDIKDYMEKKKEKKKILDIDKYYIELILDLCKENDIEVVLLSTPSMKSYNYAKYVRMKDFSKEHGLEYIDFNLDIDVKIDWQTDTADRGDHLNYSGAKKVTEYIGKVLKEKKFVDHRGDERYKDWDDSLAKFKEVFND